MKKRHLLFSILAILLVGLLLASCTVQRRPGENTPQTPQGGNRQTRFLPRNEPLPPNNVPGQGGQDMRNNTPGQGGIRNNAPGQGLTGNNTPGPLSDNRNRVGNNIGTTPGTGANQMGTNAQDRAERIANAAAKQKEVQSAACIITGNTAMVGLQFNDQYKGKLTDAIKKQVDKRVRQTDDRIDRVVVTADPDMVSRIEAIFRDIGNGRPISGFTKELNEMINRINPK